jgi:hypothetical protein
MPVPRTGDTAQQWRARSGYQGETMADVANWLIYVTSRPNESEIIPNVTGDVARQKAEDIARFQTDTVYLCRIIAGGAPIIPPFEIAWKTFGGKVLEKTDLVAKLENNKQ